MKKPCLSEEMLADYLKVHLSDPEMTAIESHLADCENCLEEFTIAERLVRNDNLADLDPVPARVTEAAVRLLNKSDAIQDVSLSKKIKSTVKDTWLKVLANLFPGPWGEPDLAPIRGSRRVVSQGVVHLTKTFKNIDAEIEIEKTKKGQAHIRVKLSGDRGQKKDVRVTLKRDKREVSSHLLSTGYVLFEDIPFGHYNLTFNSNGESIGEYFFEIKESFNG